VTQSQREIDRILNALAASSTTLNQRESTINKALTDIRPAAKTLADNTDDLAALLKQADKLGHTAKRIVDANHDDVALIVKELGPVLAEVNTNSGSVLNALDAITAAAPYVNQAVPNNYANLYATVHLGAGLLGVGALPTAGGTTGGTGGGGLLGGVTDPLNGLLGGGSTGGTTGGLGGLVGGLL
jgi:phospholipid/cholesterol/gamma-HCH transport system substrate-binding protein